MRPHRSKSKGRVLLWPISSRAITSSAAEKSKTAVFVPAVLNLGDPRMGRGRGQGMGQGQGQGQGAGQGLDRGRERRIPIDRRGRAAETYSEGCKTLLRTAAAKLEPSECARSPRKGSPQRLRVLAVRSGVRERLGPLGRVKWMGSSRLAAAEVWRRFPGTRTKSKRNPQEAGT